MNCFLFPLFFLFLKRETKNEKKRRNEDGENTEKRRKNTDSIA